MTSMIDAHMTLRTDHSKITTDDITIKKIIIRQIRHIKIISMPTMMSYQKIIFSQ